MGNAKFNKGLNESKYGYHIQGIWSRTKLVVLENGIQSPYVEELQRGYVWAPNKLLIDNPISTKHYLRKVTSITKTNPEIKQTENVGINFQYTMERIMGRK